ncbi:MAG: segregation/condensation protein A [Anaerolineae bacterium]|nr:segregation/condensation protein A [Anaerolineae bacterium]
MNEDTHDSQLHTPYEVHIPVFEGPLELLLHLIEKNELDITKVALAEVTDEFIVYVNVMRTARVSNEAPHYGEYGHQFPKKPGGSPTAQIEVVADFLAVAARLLWIKSKVLLPAPPQVTQSVPDEDDIGDELVRQLRAYRQYKEAAQWLRERDEAGLRAYIHIAPASRPKRVHIDLSGLTLEKLLATAEAVIYPAEGPRPQEAIQRPRISIVQQIQLIHRRLQQFARVSYRRLLSKTPTRVEAVVTLQAILELLKQRLILARQDTPFGDILIEPLEPPEKIP